MRQAFERNAGHRLKWSGIVQHFQASCPEIGRAKSNRPAEPVMTLEPFSWLAAPRRFKILGDAFASDQLPDLNLVSASPLPIRRL